MLTTLTRILPRQNMVYRLSLTALVAALALPVQAADEFSECKSHLKEMAISSGISPETANSVMAQAEYLERVIELDRRQPEFTTTFADYLNRRSTMPGSARAGNCCWNTMTCWRG